MSNRSRFHTAVWLLLAALAVSCGQPGPVGNQATATVVRGTPTQLPLPRFTPSLQSSTATPPATLTLVPVAPTSVRSARLIIAELTNPDPQLARIFFSQVDVATGNQEPLGLLNKYGYNFESGTHLAVSPNGRYVVFNGTPADEAGSGLTPSRYIRTVAPTSTPELGRDMPETIGPLNLYLADLEAQTVITIALPSDYSLPAGGPSWAPDSRHLVMPLGKGAGWGLFTLDVSAPTFKRLTDPVAKGALDLQPSWSPTGDAIAFLRYPFDQQKGPDRFFLDLQQQAQLYLVDADGSNLRLLEDPVYLGTALRLRDDDWLNNAPCWSPDGNWLTFLVGDKQPDIAIANARTGKMQLLAPSPGLDAHPSFSPDGKRILFVSDRDGNWEIYLASVDGAQVENLTMSPEYDIRPVWSPDGRQVAFLSNRKRGVSGFPEFAVFVWSDAQITELSNGKYSPDLYTRLAWREIIGAGH